MNKIFNINLGGYPFTIDENAFHKLNIYLDTIENHFADSEGCDEILEDIEARMAELFNEKMKNKAIVDNKDLQDVIAIMGKPADFGAAAINDDYEEDMADKDYGPKRSKTRIKTGKRLFRDGEEKVIAGVCSGVASYFGIQDPLWVRLGWIAAVMLLGIPLILYPLLWIIVPEAKTAGDKLAMKGEPANISNIAKTVEDELQDLSKTINEMTRDFGSKKKTLRVPRFRQCQALRQGFHY